VGSEFECERCGFACRAVVSVELRKEALIPTLALARCPKCFCRGRRAWALYWALLVARTAAITLALGVGAAIVFGGLRWGLLGLGFVPLAALDHRATLRRLDLELTDARLEGTRLRFPRV
jgi:hypothetical protein